MAPVTVPGVSGPFTYWNGLQQVEPERIPSARAVDVLVDSTTESQTLASGMSHASLKFFMDQKVMSVTSLIRSSNIVLRCTPVSSIP